MERVAVAVLYHEGKFLVGQRGAGDFLAGLREFPGGKIKPEESPSDAAARECLEETGLKIVVLDLCGEETHRYGSRPANQMGKPEIGKPEIRATKPRDVHLLFFACRALDALATVKAPFTWVSADDLAQLAFPAANARLLEKLVTADFIEAFWGTP